MFRSFALGLSTLAVIASLGLTATSASAKPIKFPHPHHFHGGFGPLALFGAAAALGVAASQPQSNCWVQPQAVDGPYGPYIQNVTVCN
jgi:hypothetical protein